MGLTRSLPLCTGTELEPWPSPYSTSMYRMMLELLVLRFSAVNQ